MRVAPLQLAARALALRRRRAGDGTQQRRSLLGGASTFRI